MNITAIFGGKFVVEETEAIPITFTFASSAYLNFLYHNLKITEKVVNTKHKMAALMAIKISANEFI